MHFRDEAGNRVWSAVQFAIAAITLIIAFGAFPTSEKSFVGWIIAVGLMIIGVTALVTFLTGKSLTGRRTVRRPRLQRIASIALIILSPLLIIATLVMNGTGPWSAYAVLTIGLWASLLVLALSTLPLVNAQLRQSEV